MILILILIVVSLVVIALSPSADLYINSSMCADQETNMLYHCLISSLSRVGRTKVVVW